MVAFLFVGKVLLAHPSPSKKRLCAKITHRKHNLITLNQNMDCVAQRCITNVRSLKPGYSPLRFPLFVVRTCFFGEFKVNFIHPLMFA